MYLFHYHQKIKDLTFTAIDIETTGLDYKNSEILEIAGIKFTLNGTIDSFSSLAAPTLPLSIEAQKVNGITLETLKEAPSLKTAILNFFEFIGDSIIIAHNADFDIPFLNYNCSKISIKKPKNICICTLILSRKLLNFKKNSLGFLREKLGIENRKTRSNTSEGHHEALNDCYACQRVFTEIIKNTNSYEKPISDLFLHPKGYLYFTDYL
jgi:DNA polymerase-3 subunit alpha (Gram-positive type)